MNTDSGNVVLYERIKEMETTKEDSEGEEEEKNYDDSGPEEIDRDQENVHEDTAEPAIQSSIGKVFSGEENKSWREPTREIGVQTDGPLLCIDSKLNAIMDELREIKQCMATVNDISDLEEQVEKLSALISRKKDKANKRREESQTPLFRSLPQQDLFSPGVSFTEALHPMEIDYITAPELISPPAVVQDNIPETPNKIVSDVTPVTPHHHPTVDQPPQTELVSVAEVAERKRKTRKSPNKCAVFIRNELTKVYTESELLRGRFSAYKRKYKDREVNSSALSPGRMKVLLTEARNTYTNDYRLLARKGINEVINSKCRAVKHKHRKNLYL